MPKVLVTNTGRELDAMMLRSLLVTLQINDVIIETRCGGKALCGKCAVRVVKGEKSLSPRRNLEKEKLSSMKAGADIRLACQAYAGKYVEIEVVNSGRKEE